MTASTLYEAIEPRIIWKELLGRIFSDILGDGTQYGVCTVLPFALYITSSSY